jgi:hypothetical protein
MEEFTMPRKKHPSPPSTATKPSNLPVAGKKTASPSLNTNQHPGNRWQRTKRYGWDSR